MEVTELKHVSAADAYERPRALRDVKGILMKFVFEARSYTADSVEQQTTLESLKRLGFLRSSQRLAAGVYLVEVDDEVMADISRNAMPCQSRSEYRECE